MLDWVWIGYILLYLNKVLQYFQYEKPVCIYVCMHVCQFIFCLKEDADKEKAEDRIRYYMQRRIKKRGKTSRDRYKMKRG